MMKTVRNILFVAATVLCFTACNKETTAEKIEGSYTGYSSAAFQYSETPIVNNNESMSITAGSDETAAVVFTFNRWGAASFAGVSVSESGDNATLSGKGTISMPSMSGGEATSYDAELSGTVALDKKSFNVVVTVPAVMGGTTITVKNGTAPEA